MRSFLGTCRCLGVLFWLLPFGLFAASKPRDVVAEVDGHPITVEEVQKKLAGLRVARPESKPDELKREALNEIITERLVKIKAPSIPVEQDSAFMRRADYVLSQILARELFNKAVHSAVQVTDSEIVHWYEKNTDRYWFQEMVHANHILITPVEDTLLLTPHQRKSGWWANTDKEAKAIADSLYRLIQAGCSFDSLARQWSQDMATGINGGDLGIFPRGQMVPEFDSVIFNLPIDSVSLPLRTKFGYHLVKVMAKQNRQRAPLSDTLKQLIKEELQNEKVVIKTRGFVDSLHQSANLVFNETIFGLSDSALKSQRIWAVFSQWGDTIWSDRIASQLAATRGMNPEIVLSRKQLLDILKDLITPYLMRRAAADMKIQETKSYLAHKEQLFLNEKMDRLMKESRIEYNPTPDEVETYYRTHKSEFRTAESLSVHVQQMVFKTRAEADRAFHELEAGADFVLLARKYFRGDSDIAQEAFDLGFISYPAMPQDFFAVAETLTVGTISRPVKTEWGYHLLRVLARRPDLSLEEARPKITAAIRKSKQEEHRQRWEASLREGHRISIRERVLKGIKYDPPRTGSSGQP